MAYDFPSSPTPGNVFTPAGGPTWQWDGTTWLLVPAAAVPALTAESRNRIVNGAMQISQENGVSAVGANGYAVDQFILSSSIATIGASKNPSVGPEGLASLSTWLSTAKPALAAGDVWSLNQSIEGTRISDFRWGTANAKQVVLRFSAMCNVASNFTIRIYNAAATRFFLAPFTLAAGVWKEVTVVVPGDTSGVWPTDTGQGLIVSWGLAAGSTYNAGTAGWSASNMVQLAGQTNLAGVSTNIFYLTNVGLYLDRNNTGLPPPWVMPDEAQELAACMRYWQLHAGLSNGTGAYTAGIVNHNSTTLPAIMRTSPAVATSNIAYSNANSLAAVANTKVVRASLNSVAAGNMSATFDVALSARM